MQARDAAELIEVDYDILPSATDLATTIDAATPKVWPDIANNLAFDWQIGDKAATDAEFAKAARRADANRRLCLPPQQMAWRDKTLCNEFYSARLRSRFAAKPQRRIPARARSP